MSVQAKFFVSEISHRTHSPNGAQETCIKLRAATGPGNEQWSKYTPIGAIEMVFTNPQATEQFRLGGDFIVTFEPQT